MVEGDPLTFGDVAMADLQRRHIKAILAARSDTPHAAGHLLTIIRKLTGVALDEEWIDYDPTFRIKVRAAYQGWKAWPEGALRAYEARWPVGTTPRTVYALALYFGHRRSDVAAVKWSDLEVVAGNIVQQKTGKSLWIPMHAELIVALEALEHRGDHVVDQTTGRSVLRRLGCGCRRGLAQPGSRRVTHYTACAKLSARCWRKAAPQHAR